MELIKYAQRLIEADLVVSAELSNWKSRRDREKNKKEDGTRAMSRWPLESVEKVNLLLGEQGMKMICDVASLDWGLVDFSMKRQMDQLQERARKVEKVGQYLYRNYFPVQVLGRSHDLCLITDTSNLEVVTASVGDSVDDSERLVLGVPNYIEDDYMICRELILRGLKREAEITAFHKLRRVGNMELARDQLNTMLNFPALGIRLHQMTLERLHKGEARRGTFFERINLRTHALRLDMQGSSSNIVGLFVEQRHEEKATENRPDWCRNHNCPNFDAEIGCILELVGIDDSVVDELSNRIVEECTISLDILNEDDLSF